MDVLRGGIPTAFGTVVGLGEGESMDRERRKRRQALVAWVAIGALVGVPLLSAVFAGL